VKTEITCSKSDFILCKFFKKMCWSAPTLKKIEYQSKNGIVIYFFSCLDFFINFTLLLGIIGCCISLYETNKFPPVMVVQCINVAIKCALQQSFICNQLHEHLSKIKKIILESEKGAAQNEWISVAYCICFNVCAI
jgi:hypothetical protein